MNGDPLTVAVEQVISMIRSLGGKEGNLPSTYLYNEGWMLRLILQAASEQPLGSTIPVINSPSRWASEVKLYTPFDETRGDASEGLTNADGVVGDFGRDEGTKSGLRLSDAPKRFEVFEAKMFSKLSKGVQAAANYDQAVRSIACMAQTLALAGKSPLDETWERLGFWLVAPQDQIKRGIFSREMSPVSMRIKIEARIEQFTGQGREELELWREKYFEPLLQRLNDEATIQCVSWEDLIGAISDHARRCSIETFYKECIKAAGREQQLDQGDALRRGRRCKIRGHANNESVVVCYVGEKTSRVFVPDSTRESFTVANNNLEPLEGVDPDYPLSPPEVNESRIHNGHRVRVVSPGPCRSKVEDLTALGRIMLVDNHLLKVPVDSAES